MKKVNIRVIDEILINELCDLAEQGFNTTKNIMKLFTSVHTLNSLPAISETQKASSKLPTIEFESYLISKYDLMNTFIKFKTVITSFKGEIIYENSNQNDAYILCKIGSGFMNLNPAVVCIDLSNFDVTNHKVYIATYAKEGKIKQNSSQKAFERIKQKWIDL